MRRGLWLCLLGAAALLADDGQRLLRVDHYVRVRSIAPSMNGQISQVYVREVVQAGAALRASAATGKGIVLFIHGAGTPAEVAFDVPYADYSWMAFLARAGYDVFSMDMTGYGRSTRPGPMNEPCNLTKEQQAQFVTGCAVGMGERATTMDSDWHDIDGVVDYLRKLRGVEKLNLVGWSLGGPRAGGYAAQHPEKVARIALLSPAYQRTPVAGAAAANRPPAGTVQGAPFNTQSRAEFDANWDRQLGCPDQFEMPARESVWAEMLASDPVGATWGMGVRRAPYVAGGGKGWNAEVVAKMRIPALFIAPIHDKQALPDGVRKLHTDYGAEEKVFLDLACTSHNALWEKNHLLLFRASLVWFNSGKVNGSASGIVRLGY